MSQLTTVAKVKEYLRLSNNNDDAMLARLILAASAMIETYLNRKIEIDTYTEVFSGNNTTYHICTNYPVVGVSSVGVNSVNQAIDFNDDGVFASMFPKGNRNCTISYQAGYAIVPDDIEQACIELVATKYKNIEHIDKSSISMAGETTTFITADIPAQIKIVLQQYKRVFMG